MKKKNFIAKIVSLALCAATCLVLGVATLKETEKTAYAATSVEITQKYTLADFKINETAAIRRDAPVGIRFTTNVSSAVKTQIRNQLGGDASKIQFGTLIIPTDFLGGEELTHSTPSVVVGTVSEWLNDTTYTVVLGGKGGANLGESYYNRPISARSFAVNTETGEVCYTENTANRSIGYVAYMAKNDPKSPDDSDLVVGIATATTKELVLNENISIHNDNSAGAGVIVNKYEKQSENVFAMNIGGIIEEVTVDYTTSDDAIISIVGNALEAVGKGTATITGTVKLNGVDYTCEKTLFTDHYAPSSRFTILLPAQANDYEIAAANKLQNVLLEATGVELAIVTESGNETTEGKYLSIGDTVLAKAKCSVDSLTKDTASRVQTVDNTIFVRGKTKVATLYGAQRLLKETVGYEYYLDNTYVVNATKEIIIEDKDYTPAIAYEVMQVGSSDNISLEHAAPSYTEFIVPVGADDYTGITHNSINVIKNTIDNEGVTNTSRYYTYSTLTYKDWYATNGNNFLRDGDNYKLELCYTAHGNTSTTNGRPALIEAVASAMFAQMQKEQYKSYDRIAFSQADHSSWCNCSACTAEGNATDNMLHFILDVAKVLKGKLQAVGDSRAETFKICTLFYLSTSSVPQNKGYLSELGAYMSHLEGWFAEIKADFNVPLTDVNSTYNPTALAQFNAWAEFLSTNGADMFWWGYYASTKCSFIPYDSIDALRANYALAAESGVDYMFNQTISYTTNWTRLKQYLMSELRWNAKPDDDTWNGWIENYMHAAFGPGTTAMTEYYQAWKGWANAHKADFYNLDGSSSSISKDLRAKNYMSFEDLKAWLDACNKALAALDANDPNYQIYYNNIILERLTPLYLIMYVHGEFTATKNFLGQVTGYKFNNYEYVKPYGQDFLNGAAAWGITYDGESASGNNTFPEFEAAIESVLSGATAVTVTERQTVVTGTSITVNSENIASGESYSATLITSAGEVAATSVTANDGAAAITFSAAPAVGNANLVLRSNNKTITFNNVLVVTGTIGTGAQLKALTSGSKNGYYVLTNNIEESGTCNGRANNTFKGVLDGNGYSIFNLSTNESGIFNAMDNATIKDITFVNVTAEAAAFAKTATNTTFENVSVSFTAGGPNLAVSSTGCTYKNVTVYVSKAVTTTLPEGVKLIVGADTGKTFYIPEGENEVWLRDKNLVKGDYTVNVNGELSNVSVFAEGRIKVAIKGLALGDTVKVSCDNGTNAYIYNVMRVSKFVYAESGETLPTYNGDKTALGYYNADLVQTLTVANGGGSIWDNGIWNNRVKVFAPGTQDYITVDFVAENDFIDTMFQIWPTKGAGSFSKTGVFNDSSDPTGATVSIVDEYGFKVNTVAAGKRYTLRVYDPKAEGLALSVWGTNTVYFGNVTYGKGTPVEAEPAPNVWVGDNRVLSIYNGDVTKLGYAEGTIVFSLENNTPENVWGDGWAKRMIFGAPGTQDYITLEFVAKEDVEYTGNTFHVWGKNGSPSMGDIAESGKAYPTADYPTFSSVILDEYGLAVTDIKAGKHYFMSISCAGLTEIQVGALDSNVFYIANVAFNNGELPTPIQPLIYGVDNSAVPVYEGDETALGFEEGTLVFEAKAGASTWNDNAVKFYTDSAKNCVAIDFVLSNTLNAGNQFMIWTSKVSGSAAAFINNGKVTQNSIDVEILDADGNAVTEFAANTKYTFKIYHAGSTTVTIALVGDTQAGKTIYYSNDYADSNDEFVPPVALPENIVKYSTDGGHTGETLAKYAGDATVYGWTEDTYVFATNMTAAWDDRAVIPTNPEYDYMDVEFVVTSGLWYFNAWVVNANGMLDGSYLVAENASNATYGSGYAPHTPNTGANGGNTKIQVLDMDGNVLTGGRSNGTRYVLRVYLKDESLTQVHIGQANTNMLFANVTYGNLPVEYPIKQDGGFLPVYEGDATAHGFEEGTFLQYMITETMDNAWGTEPTSGKTREQLAAYIPGEVGKYVTIKFATSEDISGSLFYVWCMLGNGHVSGGNGGLNFTTTTYGRVLDVNGFAVTSIAKNTVYVLELYFAGTDTYKVSNLCKTGMEMYFASDTITCSNKSFAAELPGAGDPVQAGGSNKNAITVYNGDETALGYDAGTRVYKYVGATTNDKISIKVDSANYDYVDVQMVFDAASTKTWFLGFVLSGSSFLNGADAYVLSGDTIRFNANASNPLDREIKFLDAEGNVVNTALKTGVVYTLRVYIKANNVTEIQMRQVGVTAYLANVTHGVDQGVVIEKPEEVVVDGETKAELPQYAGDATALGFADTDYVFEHVTTDSSWNSRAHIGNNSEANFLVFDFASNNPQNLTVWFARNGNVIGGFSNIVTPTGYIAANECAARIIYVFDENNVAVTQMVANTKYTMWVYLDGADNFDGIAVGNGSNITLYYANIHYVYNTGEDILRQGDSNALLPEYAGDVTALGFEADTFVQTLVGTSDGWVEDIYANRARITADGTQDYIAVDFVVASELTGGYIFYLWAASANGNITSSLTCSAFTIGVLDVNGNNISVSSIEAGKRYTLYVYDSGATYLAIGAYCNNTIYFGNVRYGKGDIPVYNLLKDGNGALATYTGDATALGFKDGMFVQQWTTTPSSSWASNAESTGVKIYGTAGKYTSILFSLESNFTRSDLFMFGWGHNASGYSNANNYILGVNALDANAQVYDMNGKVVEGDLTANTPYILEIYMPANTTWYNVGNVGATGRTVYFATKTIKMHATSIANSPVTGSADNTVTLHYGVEELGFGKNEVVKRLDTETITGNWWDSTVIQPTIGVGRGSWLIKVASEAGKKVTIRFALSQDYTSGNLFYVWSYSNNSGTCPADGSVTLSNGSLLNDADTKIAKITDEAGNAVSELKAGQVYELTLYVDTAIKYDIANLIPEGMTTYVSAEVSYEDYVA